MDLRSGMQRLKQFSALVPLLVLTSSAHADVTTDGSLGSRPIGPSDSSNTFVVDEDHGRLSGANLFHSFATFDLDLDEAAIFTGRSSIRNVVARVTGGLSTIDGAVISQIPGANLFLLNSQGIVVGQGARFEAGGAVHLSTANYVQFGEDPASRFFATPTPSEIFPDLDVSAFGFLSGTSSQIRLRQDPSNPATDAFRFQNLALIAHDIRLEQFDAVTDGGRIALVAVGGSGDVIGVDALHCAPSCISGGALGSGTIALTNSSIGVDERAPNPGGLTARISSGFLDLLDSTIETESGAGASGGVDVDAGEFVMRGSVVRSVVGGGAQAAGPISIRVHGDATIERSDVESRAEGRASPGSVTIAARNLSILGDSRVGASAVGGDGGAVDVTVTARNVAVLGGAQLGFFSAPSGELESGAGISSAVRVQADENVLISGFPDRFRPSAIVNQNQNGNDDPQHSRVLEIQARTLELTDAASLESTSQGTGNAGNIRLLVGTLRVSDEGTIASSVGRNAPLQPGTPRATGNGGAIEIVASEAVEISGKFSFIDSGTRGPGKGGDLTIRTPRLVNDGAEIRTTTTPNARDFKGGDAGDVGIVADVVEVRNGGLIRADSSFLMNIRTGATFSGPAGLQGDAGDVDIQARSVLIEGKGPDPLGPGERVSRISSRTGTSGAGGSVSIRADTVRIGEGTDVSAESLSSGRAGGVRIEARDIDIADGATVRTTSQLADGGDIFVSGDRLVLRGAITTRARGSGGNIEIGSDLTVLQGNGTIVANAADGEGGDVKVVSRFLIGDLARIQASSERGLPGTISIVSPELSLIRDVADLPGTFLAAQKLLRPQCAARESDTSSRFVLAERGGVGASPQGWLLAFDDDDSALPNVAAREESSQYVAEARMNASEALRSGDYAAARRAFLEASASTDSGTRSAALRGKAQVDQAAGEFRESVRSLLEALLEAEKSGSAARVAAVLGSLGNAYVALEEAELATDHLARGLELARRSGAWALAAEILINQGNHRAIQGELEAALESYGEAAQLAAQAERPLHAVQALANGSRVALRAGRAADAADLVERARQQIGVVPAVQDRVDALTHLAQTELLLADRDPASEKARMLRAHELLMEAVKVGVQLSAHRASSYALGSLAALYERDHRYEEALQGTYRAIAAAEQAGAAESLYRLHWQAGRILGALGRGDDALEALRRAVSLVQKLRPESALSYTRSDVSFRDSVAPMYVALLDALLSRADGLTDPQQAESLLLEARSTREEMRAAELRDYFRDECVADLAQRARPVEAVSTDAAIVYPVVLPDRVELLVSTGGRLQRHVARVGADEVTAQASALRQALQRSLGQSAYLEPAQSLYRWLVEPYAQDLEKAGVRTLVFVPDGPLGTIPMAALHDGKDFLIRRFAVAVTPGLSLTDPRPLERERLKVLVAGLSEPVQDFPELPHVVDEVDAIRSLYSNTTVLLNDGFTQQRTEQALTAQPFSILHIASHGSFSADAERSFLLTHDGQISMRDLTDLVGRTRFRDQPLELLVLSACETAAGDERAALGLAGVAIRSGARSALGSLWSIQDEAASKLIAQFYTQLREPGVSRAEALRRAQLALLDQEQFRDPGSWSGFLLINSWL